MTDNLDRYNGAFLSINDKVFVQLRPVFILPAGAGEDC